MNDQDQSTVQHIHTLIIGAGISGIGMSVYLKLNRPMQDFLIFEQHIDIGGTWHLFQYPDIRSDSDMFTFGYSFKHWDKEKVFAEGSHIQQYLKEVIVEYNLQQKIKLQHKIKTMNWNSKLNLWELLIENNHQQLESWTANFIMGCTGYYNHQQGYQPEYPDQNNFKGKIVHPQYWSKDIDLNNKKVIIIGSGATAITLLPALVKENAKVTLLQRSPTYIISLPSIDITQQFAKRFFPDAWVYQLIRQRNIAFQYALYKISKSQPKLIKKLLLAGVKLQLDNKIDMCHFTPNYDPWDQRICVAPDGDFFKVLKSGHAHIETAYIKKFLEYGIELESGKVLEADIIISATGLDIQLLGGIQASIDGKVINPKDRLIYQGIMVGGVPNFALIFGYTNASWTLKIDVVAQYLSRLFDYMQKNHYALVIPEDDIAAHSQESFIGGSLTSGYIQRANSLSPRQGKYAPWKRYSNYYQDKKMLAKACFEDGILKFK